MAEKEPRARSMLVELRPHILWDGIKLLAPLMIPAAYVVLQKIRGLGWDWFVFGGLFMLAAAAYLMDGRPKLGGSQTIRIPESMPIASPTKPTASSYPERQEVRISVGKEITPQFLLGLYATQTSVQAGKVSEIYIGKWIHVSGVVTDVQEFNDLDGDLTMVHLHIQGDQPKKRSALVLSVFRRPWAERALMLTRGANVNIFGQIKETSWKWLDLDHCELE